MKESVKPAPVRGKPGRAPAGHVEWTGRVWRVRVTMSDGRRWIALPTSLGPDDRDQAQALAKGIQEAARGAVPMGDVVTVASYATRWIESLSEGPTRGTYSRALTGHVLPVLGAMDVRGVTSKDVRALVSKWDAAVAKGVQATNSVTGYWTACRLLFKSACASKRDDLRVRTDNPCAGVEGPTRSRIEVAHQWLFPSEFLAVMACLKISVKVRHWIALFVLTGCRLNELRGLRRRDIDLARDVVHIRCQRDPRTGALRPTKGKRARTIPLEPTLRPLLEASQGAPDDYVVTIPKGQVAMLLRALRLAGVTRPELFERSASSNPLRVHDLRGTYATWCALRGDPPLAIQRRLGHASLDQTQVYLRTAELFGAKGEAPFARFEIVLDVPGYVPAVPGALMGHREKGSNVEEGYNSPICRILLHIPYERHHLRTSGPPDTSEGATSPSAVPTAIHPPHPNRPATSEPTVSTAVRQLPYKPPPGPPNPASPRSDTALREPCPQRTRSVAPSANHHTGSLRHPKSRVLPPPSSTPPGSRSAPPRHPANVPTTPVRLPVSLPSCSSSTPMENPLRSYRNRCHPAPRPPHTRGKPSSRNHCIDDSRYVPPGRNSRWDNACAQCTTGLDPASRTKTKCAEALLLSSAPKTPPSIPPSAQASSLHVACADSHG